MMTRYATLEPEAPLSEAIDMLLKTSQADFPVVDRDGRLAGLLSRTGMIRALKESGPDASIGAAMTRDIPTIGVSGRLDEAFRLLQEKSAPAVGVVDASGRLAGFITSETIGEMLMVQEAWPEGGRLTPWRRARRG
jgi:CBS domain-containing protein